MFLLPRPKEIIIKEEDFTILPSTKIILEPNCSSSIFEAAIDLREEIFNKIKIKLPITKGFKTKKNSIYLKKAEGKSEAYELNVDKEGAVISGGDDAGVFYGIQTLRQIIRNSAPSVPSVTIKDEPYFAYRGFYHDVTRGKVPTLDTLKELADRAAFYKINQIQLYIEHTFAFENLSEVWIGADPLTAEEILLFDEYCRKKHIELVPSLSTFGHLYTLLTSKSYKHLCELEVEDKAFSWYDRMAHHTLDISNSESIQLIDKMLEEFIPLFSSDKFNICCDETFDLGEGKNKELAERLGKGHLYVEFLNKVFQSVRKYDKKVMFWGDIILRHPELLSEIPKDITCLNWDYAANPSENNVKIISESRVKQYVCPGVGGWNMMMNSFDSSFSNINKMVKYGKDYNAIGVLNTDWGDFGHINLFSNSMPGMIYGAALSWNPDYNEDFDSIDETISKLEYGENKGKLVGLLRELSRCQIATHFNIAMWAYDKFLGAPKLSEEQKRNLFTESNERFMEAHNRIKELSKELMELSMSISRSKDIDLQEFLISTRGIDLLNALALVIKKFDFNVKDTTLIYTPKQLAELIEYWLYDYMAAWRRRNKESELYRIREHFTGICSYLRAIELK